MKAPLTVGIGSVLDAGFQKILSISAVGSDSTTLICGGNLGTRASGTGLSSRTAKVRPFPIPCTSQKTDLVRERIRSCRHVVALARGNCPEQAFLHGRLERVHVAIFVEPIAFSLLNPISQTRPASYRQRVSISILVFIIRYDGWMRPPHRARRTLTSPCSKCDCMSQTMDGDPSNGTSEPLGPVASSRCQSRKSYRLRHHVPPTALASPTAQ